MFKSTSEQALSKPSFKKKVVKTNYEILFNLTPKLFSQSKDIEKVVEKLLNINKESIMVLLTTTNHETINEMIEMLSVILYKKKDMSYDDFKNGLEYYRDSIVPLNKDLLSKIKDIKNENIQSISIEGIEEIFDFIMKIYEFSKEYHDEMSFEVFGLTK